MSHLNFTLPIFHLLKFYLTSKAQLQNPSLIPLTQTSLNLTYMFPATQASTLFRAQ